MSSTEPSGGAQFLQAIPEFSSLMKYPEVSNAVQSGDLHKVHAALVALWRDKSNMDAPLIEKVLADRRLFLTPIKSAPSMFTMNGFGTRLYGEDQLNPADQTYISTLFLCGLYIPIFPLSQYLVRKTGGTRYEFFGKVPASGTVRAWRMVVGLATIVAVLGAGTGIWQRGQSVPVHFVNGLDNPVEIDAGPIHTKVAPGQRVREGMKAGHYQVKVTGGGGKVLEEQPMELPAFTDLVAYNVLGAAPLFTEHVLYTTKATGDESNRTDFHAGQTVVPIKTVHYAFTEPDKEIKMSGERETRVQVGLLPGGWGTSARYLMNTGKVAGAAELAQRVCLVEPDNDDAAWIATDLTRKAQGPDAAVTFAKKLLDRAQDSEEAQRLYHHYLLLAGKSEEAQRLSRALWAAKPGTALAGYLLARAEAPDKALSLYKELVQKYPEDSLITSSYAQTLFAQRRFEESLPVLEKLAELKAPWSVDRIFLHARDLVALKHPKLALELVEGLEAEDLSLAVLHARLVALASPSPAPAGDDALAQKLKGWKTAPELPALFAAQLGRPLPDKAKLAGLSDDTRQLVELLAAATRDPGDAVKRASTAPASVLWKLDGTTAVLLGAEALRSGNAQLASRLFDQIDEAPLPREAVRAFLQSGQEAPELGSLDLEWQAALELVRGRALEAQGQPGKALYDRAREDDLLHGTVTLALERWPHP